MAEILRDLWRYRELFYFFAWRDVKLRYRQTLLGALWAIIQPLFTMLVFTVLFGRVVNVPTNGIPYPIFYLSALLPWTYFSATLTQSGASLIGNSTLLTKIYFPRLILPISAALIGLVDLVIGTVVLAAMMAYYGLAPTGKVLLWPVLALVLFVQAGAIGMFLSAVNVKYRDVKFVVPFLLQLWLFATPIIYPTSLIPARYHALIALNPLTGLIEAFRAICVPGAPLNLPLLGTSVLLTAALLIACTMYFHTAEAAFSDII